MKTKYFKISQMNPSRVGIPIFLLLFLMAMLFYSCKKTQLVSVNVNAPLVLTTSGADSVNAVALEQIQAQSNAITFNWTTGSNKGTNASISYLLQIDEVGHHFGTPVQIFQGKAAYTQNLTVAQLNDSLLSHWNAQPDSVVHLEARIIATVSAPGIQPDTSNQVSMLFTPYLPVSTTLYLIGDATLNGWNTSLGTSMVADPSDPTTFIFQGNLTAGQFEFITTLGNSLPSYVMGADSSHLIFRTVSSQPDNRFTIDSAGVYSITLNLLSLNISVTKLNQPPYSKLWILGDATPNGWNINNPNQMVQDLNNPFIFKYDEVLNAGDFKIPTALGNFTTTYYRPLTNEPPITNTGVQLSAPGSGPADANDYKWKIYTPGPYKITLNLLNNTIAIIPFVPYTQLWMVGDATPNGWNINQPSPMTADPNDPYIFSYSGPLTAGEFKIPTKTGDWGCDYFRPYINHPAISDTTAQFVAHDSGPADINDYKWQITTPGNYVVTLNQLYETISIIKQ
ncbi:MAG: SusF/SusE family outer membrane protein [Chitinophagaceae bacterium]